ncbi:hypothetical protein HK104_001947 [Borealophlyctis nickersoniae]|nr:hypothetical protein HK104_001947 [Borealophlyctis nickersoniae]
MPLYPSNNTLRLLAQRFSTVAHSVEPKVGPLLQHRIHRESLENPVHFWGSAAKSLDWAKPCDRVFVKDPNVGVLGYRWFPDGRLNTCYNALDRHVKAGNGKRQALIYDSPVTGEKCAFTYSDLLAKVETFAAVLRKYGVTKGSRVIIYMHLLTSLARLTFSAFKPMIPEAVIGMLACARLGAIHSVVFGGFAAKELPLMDEAINHSSHKPSAEIVLQRSQCTATLDSARGERDWEDEVAKANAAKDKADCVELASHDPLYLLYTSGSTGVPKGVVRDNGGHAVALRWAMENVFGVGPDDVFFTASDVGWVVGHSFIVYGPLLRGCTTVLYEGKPVGTPDAGGFWRVISDHKVNVLSTAPTAIRAIKRDDPEGKLLAGYDLSSLRDVFLAGERSDPDTVNHFSRLLNLPIRDNYWQTETGWPITAPCAFRSREDATPPRVGSAGMALPGYDIQVMPSPASPEQEPIPRPAKDGETKFGNLALKLPLPPGSFPTLWNNDAGFVKSYLTKFPGYMDLTDAGFIDADGYVHIMARTDDVINTAGHRLSTGHMEEIVAAHPHVAECAVVGVRDTLKGEKPLAFIVLKTGHTGTHSAIKAELIASIRHHIGKFACFDRVHVVHKLPKTRSGKVLRRILRAIANGDAFEPPATIDDVDVLEDIKKVIS